MIMPDEPTKRKRQLTEFPEGWALGDPERATFRKYNPASTDNDIEYIWSQFEAHHRAKGSKFKLWSQAWVLWAIRTPTYGFRPTPRPPIGFHHNFGSSGMANLARHLGRGK